MKIKLGISTKANVEDPYCMIVFKSYDSKTKTANFTLYQKDLAGLTTLLKEL
ncbi:MAG: hypothetical protein OIF32_06185 [Campylobacterales bacterium]|nr:hypothetical protein [Campylobacterales bacterium]